MKHAPLTVFAFLLVGTPVRAQYVPEPEPWVQVDVPFVRGGHRIDWIDLIRVSDDSYVACYQLIGHRLARIGTNVVRSTDAGRTWQRVQSFTDVQDATLAWDGTTTWLLATKQGRPVVLCALDAAVTSFGAPVGIRGSDGLIATESSIVHAGRVWRVFRRSLIPACSEMREQVLVASAELGADLQDPASWRWSGELPSNCIGATGYGSPMRFVGCGDDALNLTIERTGEFQSKGVLELSDDAWRLSVVREPKPWKHLPAGADRFQRNAPDGYFYAMDVESSDVGTSDRKKASNVLALVRSHDLETWHSPVLLHDAGEEPMEFGHGTVRVLGDDLGVLFPFRTDRRKDVHAGSTGQSTLAFLRVPQCADRKTSDPPLWGPALPR